MPRKSRRCARAWPRWASTWRTCRTATSPSSPKNGRGASSRKRRPAPPRPPRSFSTASRLTAGASWSAPTPNASTSGCARPRNAPTTSISSTVSPRKWGGKSAADAAADREPPLSPLVSLFRLRERSGVMNKATSRRALLHVGALSGIAAARGVALPALARDAKKTGAEEAISPPEDLMREHAILDRILLVYEAGMRRAGQGEDIDPAIFEHSAGIVRDFIHDYHAKSDEELLFPRFKTAGRLIELVNV